MNKTPLNRENLTGSIRKLQNSFNSKSIQKYSIEEKLEFKFDKQSHGKNRSVSAYSRMVDSLEYKHAKKKKLQYIVFISHGLEGNPFDMRHIRAALLNVLPDSVVYILNNNFQLTNQCLNNQAKRMALEVKDILRSINFYGK